MHEHLRTHLPVIITAVVVSTVFAAGPTVATAAFDAVNADKVDGKHAVGAGASAQQRAGKLVATSGKGRLPNSIIRKAPNADRLDGRNGRAYGLARNQGMVFSWPIDGGASLSVDYATVATLTLTVPANGYLSLTAQGSFNANDSTSYIDALIKEGSTTVRSTHWEPGDDDGWYDQQQALTTVIPVLKGKHTYSLQLREQSAAIFAQYRHTQLVAQFFPKGKVAPFV